MIKGLKVFLFFLLCYKSYSQSNDLPCDSVATAPAKAYFEGYSYKYEETGIECFRMERSFFQKDFRLSLSDTSYQVLRFNLVAGLVDGTLLEIVGDSEGISGNSDEYIKLLKKMTNRSLVTVDNIRVSKNDQCYKVPSFIGYFIR